MGSIVDDYQIGPKSKDIAAAYDEQLAGPNAKIGRPPTLRIRFPESYKALEGPGILDRSKTPTDGQTFMVYQPLTDEMAPLTQERLDQLLAVEKRHRQLKETLRVIAADNPSYV